MNNDLEAIKPLLPANMTDAAMEFIDQLMSIHGEIKIASEASGYQIYIPDPELLETDGIKELTSRHLAFNITKYNEYLSDLNSAGTLLSAKERMMRRAQRRPTKPGPPNENIKLGMCMKTGRLYTIKELLSYPPISERVGFDTKTGVSINKNEWMLTPDEHGVLVPPMPGKCIPLTDLPDTHPAIGYLRLRGYDPASLVKQFGAEFCEQETPEDNNTGVYYPSLAGHWKLTPQGRIILYSIVNGSKVMWQGRVIEYVAGKDKYYLHPYTHNWDLCERRTADGWEPIRKGWKMQKYRSCQGGKRSTQLMGWDAAIEWNKRTGANKIILCEGPLDAARIGPPAVACLGKSVTEDQLKMIVGAGITDAWLVSDNDTAGGEMRERAVRTVDYFFRGKLNLNILRPPAECKDIGEATPEQAAELLVAVIGIEQDKAKE